MNKMLNDARYYAREAAAIAAYESHRRDRVYPTWNELSSETRKVWRDVVTATASE